MAAKKNGNKKGGDAAVKTKSIGAEIRELVMSFGAAVLLALLIKYMLVEVFVIPSGSMEPTLHGRPDGGDRVLCTKVNYRFREPQRWEVFVFLFPGDNPKYHNENFIKRCVGLPGDTVALVRGDVFLRKDNEDFVRQVKSNEIQNRIWIPVYEENFSDLSSRELKEFWHVAGNGSVEISKDKSLLLASNRTVSLTYRPRVRDLFARNKVQTLDGIPDRYVVRQSVEFTCPLCGARLAKTVRTQKIAGRCTNPKCRHYMLENSVTHYGRRSDLVIPSTSIDYGYTEGEGKYRSTGYHWVPDLRLKMRAKPVAGENGTTFTLETYDNVRIVQAIFTAGEKGTVELRVNGKPLADTRREINFAADKWHDVEFYTLDGEARLYLDGKEVFSAVRIDPEIKRSLFEPRKTGVGLALSGGAIMLDDLFIDRDIYYYADPKPGNNQAAPIGVEKRITFKVPEDGFFALGDNCPSSNDSRSWGMVPRENLRGPAIFVWWPPHRIKMIQ